jgi:hypothetical protein
VPELSSEAVIAIATAVLAIATVTLTIATVAYARAAHATVSELQMQRIASIRPHLYLTPWVLGAIHPIAQLTNTGPGWAVNIRGELRLFISEELRWQHELSIGAMAPGITHRFDPTGDALPLPGGVQQAVGENRQYVAELAYDDVEGTPYSLHRVIDWRELTERVFGAHLLITRDHIDEIAKDIGRIRAKVDAAVSTFDGVRVQLQPPPDDAETGGDASASDAEPGSDAPPDAAPSNT